MTDSARNTTAFNIRKNHLNRYLLREGKDYRFGVVREALASDVLREKLKYGIHSFLSGLADGNSRKTSPSGFISIDDENKLGQFLERLIEELQLLNTSLMESGFEFNNLDEVFESYRFKPIYKFIDDYFELCKKEKLIKFKIMLKELIRTTLGRTIFALGHTNTNITKRKLEEGAITTLSTQSRLETLKELCLNNSVLEQKDGDGNNKFLNGLESFSFALRTKDLPREVVDKFLSQIHLIQLKNLDSRQKRNADSILIGLKKVLAQIFLEKFIETRGALSSQCSGDIFNSAFEVVFVNEIEPLIKIWQGIFSKNSKPETRIYFLNNSESLSRAFLTGLTTKEFKISIPTCPDYSGNKVPNTNGGKVFQFDFKDIGNIDENTGERKIGVGVVAAKGFDLVENITAILEKYGSVKIVHFLPTWEFPNKIWNEGSGAEKTKAETTQALRAQLEEISREYERRSIEVEVRLSCDFISDEEFWLLRDLKSKEILEKSKAEDKIGTKLKNVIQTCFNHRRQLCESWYPLQENETEADWEIRMKDEIIPRSLAEYQIIGEMCSGNVIGLDCSSSVMNKIYEALNLPVIHGRSAQKDVSSYSGD